MPVFPGMGLVVILYMQQNPNNAVFLDTNDTVIKYEVNSIHKDNSREQLSAVKKEFSSIHYWNI